jgi:hypothetical protein
MQSLKAIRGLETAQPPHLLWAQPAMAGKSNSSGQKTTCRAAFGNIARMLPLQRTGILLFNTGLSLLPVIVRLNVE